MFSSSSVCVMPGMVSGTAMIFSSGCADDTGTGSILNAVLFLGAHAS